MSFTFKTLKGWGGDFEFWQQGTWSMNRTMCSSNWTSQPDHMAISDMEMLMFTLIFTMVYEYLGLEVVVRGLQRSLL